MQETEKENKEFIVTPWEVTGKIDYDKLIREFGMGKMPELPKEFKESLIFRRGIVYGQRDFGKVLDAVKNKKKLVMMTGLMPTGKFHIGHALVVEQMLTYQKLGAKIYIAVADVEAYNTRNTNVEELHKTAIEEYITNYIALGLSAKNCEIYFQSKRSKDAKKANAYYALAGMVARHTTFNEVKAIYGEITPAKLSSALLQVSDMIHPQLPEFEGTCTTVVPVGSDQDPHIKLARDILQRFKIYPMQEISSTYHVFLPGLQGGKMSSSIPESYVALTDAPEIVEKKIKKHAFSGGRDTLEEHRRLGGNPDIDVSFQWLRMFFEQDDKRLENVYHDYKSGKLLSGELKMILIEKVNAFLKEHQRKRENAKKVIDRYVELD